MQMQQEAMSNVLSAVASLAASQPVLYGPDNRPLRPSGSFGYQRDAAKRTGTMKNWLPKRLFGKQAEALERSQIVDRSIDLTNNDPNAAGLIDNIATYVVGSGLVPHPTLDLKVLDIDKERAKTIQTQMRAVYNTWSPFADAGQRMTFGEIQYLSKLNIMRFGENFLYLPMIKDPARPYSLACQFIHSLRVKTPADLINSPDIKDGIELGEYGEAKCIWIKKSDPTGILPDTSKNFVRMPVRNGHRWNILHNFVCKDPEQVRGIPFLAPAMKYFRDFNDLLNSELVSNIVTSALTYFIEVTGGGAPWDVAQNMGTVEDTRYDSDGASRTMRYEETYPGAILYGASGQKPHLLAANRPGVTFEPFTKVVKKAMSLSVNLPYPVAFKDMDDVDFAGFRSAMLDAWRVFEMERKTMGSGMCQPIRTMLMEEAYLRNDLDISDFYPQMHAYTRAEWRGAPKGDIEPIKAIKADLLANKGNIKSKKKIIIERGDDYDTTMDDLQFEKEDQEERGIATNVEDADLTDKDLEKEQDK